MRRYQDLGLRGIWARLIGALCAVVLLATPVLAVNPEEMLQDPALEARARALSEDLRCVVCQNQNIDSSNAPIARDLRILLRERLSAGDSDDAAVKYIVARYGNFVLLKPPYQMNTIALWVGPMIFVILALAWATRFMRGGNGADDELASAELSMEERSRVDAILGKRDHS